MHFDGYVEIAGSSDGLPWLLLITNALSASIVHWYRSKEQQHAAAGRKREKESIRIPIILVTKKPFVPWVVRSRIKNSICQPPHGPAQHVLPGRSIPRD